MSHATADESFDCRDLHTAALSPTRGVEAWLEHNGIDLAEVTADLAPTATVTDQPTHQWYHNAHFDVLVDDADRTILRVVARDRQTTIAPRRRPLRAAANGYDPNDLTTLTPTAGVRRHAEIAGIDIDKALRHLDASTTTRIDADTATAEDPEPATTFHTEWCTVVANLHTGMILRITVHETSRTELAQQLMEKASVAARNLDAAKRARAAERDTEPDADSGDESSVDRLPAPQTIDDLMDGLVERGCHVELRRSGHYSITHPGTPGVRVATGSTPSDRRSLLNTVSDVRRVLGIDVRLPLDEA